MKIKGIELLDFVNYKKPSVFIAFPRCSFKCDRENGVQMCQNRGLDLQPNIDISMYELVDTILRAPVAEAIVIGGLEPFDSETDLFSLVSALRMHTDKDIVIYTGYTEEELWRQISILKKYLNIIIKFGRFRPNQTPHFDEVLGVNLASDNQYAKKI